MAAGIPGRTTAARRGNIKNLKQVTREHDLPCALCGEPIDTYLDWRDPQAFAYDHKKSRIAYPELADDLANGQPSHSLCNMNKGASDQKPVLGGPGRVW